MLNQFMSEEFFRENSDKGASLYHKVEDREYWERFNGRFFNWLEGVDEFRKTAFNILKASDYIKFFTQGDREVNQVPYFHRRNELIRVALLEAVENKGRYFNDILDLLWAILEETIWSVAAHKGYSGDDDVLPHEGMPALELFTAETAAEVTSIYYIFKNKFDELSPEIGARIKRKVISEIYTPYIEKDLKWMGFGRIPNNWNPWITSNVVKCIINLGEYGDLEYKVLARSAYIIDKYFSHYPEDGGCDEGAGYWGHAGGCFVVYADVMNKITGGKMNLAASEKVNNLAEFYMNVYTSGEHILGFSDTNLSFGECWSFMWYVGKVMNNEKIKAFAKYDYGLHGKGNSFIIPDRASGFRMLFIAEALAEIEEYEGKAEFKEDVYYDSIKVMVAREKTQAPFGLFLSSKASHNGESHNHLDVGNFILYKNEVPFIVDAGKKTYTAQTFSPRRYEIWNTRSSFHNLPIIGGEEEKPGREFAAENVVYENSSLKAELKGAYGADFINSFVREISLDREKSQVVLKDTFDLKEEKEVEFIIITPAEINISDKIYFEYKNEKIEISCDKSFTADIQNIDDDDKFITRAWGTSLKKLVLKTKTKTDAFEFVIK